MGKFCTKCGRPLAEGEICNCQTTGNMQSMPDIRMETPQQEQGQPQQQYQKGQLQQQYHTQYQQSQPQQQYQTQYQQGQAQQQYQTQYQQQAQQSYQQTQQAVSDHMSKTVGTFINMVKQPITIGRQLVASNETGVAISFIILQALMSGFFALTLMAKVGGTVEALIEGLVGGYMDSSLKFPYGRIFILTVLASAVLSFLLALLLMVGNMVIKNVVTYAQMLNCIAVRSVWISILTLVALILFVLNPMLGFCIYMVAGLWGVIAVTMVVPGRGETNDDRLSFTLFIVMLVFILITLVVMFKIIGPNYFPDAFKMGLNEIKSELFDAGSLF